MRKDFEDKVLIFPFFDAISLGLASIDDNVVKRKMDTLEDCVMEIEELKNELSMIIITQTPSGRDKWDTPEIKIPGGRKDRLRKDRYSSLLMANMAARTIQRTPAPITYETLGGFAEQMKAEKEAGPDYIGPAWFTEGIGDVY
tara:strand:- start:37 stop:465 length:429 start_codon:yes stop_codon:yes gene_type:complete